MTETRIYSGKKRVSSTNGVGKIGQPHAEKWNWTTFLHITQNKLKMDGRPKCEIGIHQKPREEYTATFVTLATATSCKIHLWSQGKQKQNEVLGLNQDKKASAQQKKQSTKLKDNLQNGRRYLQMTHQIKG